MKHSAYLPVCLAFLIACGSEKDMSEPDAVDQFLDEYTRQYLELNYEDSEADWISNIRITPGDTMNSYQLRQAREKLARFTGSAEVIKTTRQLLSTQVGDSLQVRQLERILFKAADKPATVPDLVAERIKLEASQTERLYSFEFQINGESVSTNDIDDMLTHETNTDKRLEAWKASKEVAVDLKPSMKKLRDLRNQTVQALGYDNYFSYQVSEYGMTVPEMTSMCEGFITDIWPLYRELHTYVRYQLAEKYGQKDIPQMIPAHWLPNRWGQDWSGLLQVKGVDLDQALENKEPEWLVRQAERFYVSLGFQKLPESFYEKSSLYPLPLEAGYKKNNHASAWHMDLKDDVRCLMSVVPNSSWYETTHHELGHIYYYISYSTPQVPPVLRRGANRAFHEAVGSMMGLAAMQKPFLVHIGLIEDNVPTDEIQSLLKEALNYIPFIPWSAGVMTMFEKDLYSQPLPIDQFNQSWWELKRKYQGIVPPEPRSEEYNDPASKTHITDDAAQYYDYALSYILLFQLHQHIARNILNQDPHSTNYYGSRAVGDFLKTILEPGMTRDWRELIQESTGQPISAKAMLEYFEPLMAFLQEANKGRVHTLPTR